PRRSILDIARLLVVGPFVYVAAYFGHREPQMGQDEAQWFLGSETPPPCSTSHKRELVKVEGFLYPRTIGPHPGPSGVHGDRSTRQHRRTGRPQGDGRCLEYSGAA